MLAPEANLTNLVDRLLTTPVGSFRNQDSREGVPPVGDVYDQYYQLVVRHGRWHINLDHKEGEKYGSMSYWRAIPMTRWKPKKGSSLSVRLASTLHTETAEQEYNLNNISLRPHDEFNLQIACDFWAQGRREVFKRGFSFGYRSVMDLNTTKADPYPKPVAPDWVDFFSQEFGPALDIYYRELAVKGLLPRTPLITVEQSTRRAKKPPIEVILPELDGLVVV